MYCCIILHNMILQDLKFDVSEYADMYVSPESNIQHTWVERCERLRRKHKELWDKKVHDDLRHDIVEHLWNLNHWLSSGIVELLDKFQTYGTVQSVEVPRNAETGISKGCGYVTMSSLDEAKAAIAALDGSDSLIYN
ncbi:28 kDa ribonucleoprotein, chloroplastic [Tanacetum coccineum]